MLTTNDVDWRPRGAFDRQIQIDREVGPPHCSWPELLALRSRLAVRRATLGEASGHSWIPGSCIGCPAGRCSAVDMERNQVLRIETPVYTVPDRLRWTADLLVLASKALSILACVQGLDYPPDLHRTAQRDLRAWASYLDNHPPVAAELELASVVEGISDSDRCAVGERAVRPVRPREVPPTPVCGPIP